MVALGRYYRAGGRLRHPTTNAGRCPERREGLGGGAAV